jgi:hypothetical protein
VQRVEGVGARARAIVWYAWEAWGGAGRRPGLFCAFLSKRRGWLFPTVAFPIPVCFVRSEAFVVVSAVDAAAVAQHCRLARIPPVSAGVLLFEELVHVLTCIGDLGDYEGILAITMQVGPCV